MSFELDCHFEGCSAEGDREEPCSEKFRVVAENIP